MLPLRETRRMAVDELPATSAIAVFAMCTTYVEVSEVLSNNDDGRVREARLFRKSDLDRWRERTYDEVVGQFLDLAESRAIIHAVEVDRGAVFGAAGFKSEYIETIN